METNFKIISVIPEYKKFDDGSNLVWKSKHAAEGAWMLYKNGSLEIKDDSIYIPVENGTEQKAFKLKEITNCEIHYFTNRMRRDAEGLIIKSNIPWIQFKFDGKVYRTRFDCSKKIMLEIFNYLYESAILFREFISEKRVYMGKKPLYRDIQALKKIHGFKWSY